MAENNSATGNKFGFNNTNTGDNKQNPTAPAVVDNTTVEDKPKVTLQEEMDKRANERYLDRRSITIALVKNYSLYREANRATLPKRVDYIGSSVSSSRTLSSNKTEVDTYFPRLIGLSPNDPNFIQRVKQYLNNIQIKVDELGKTFDISFEYYHKKDYDRISKLEQDIEDRYKFANRQNLVDLRKALKQKIEDINELEISKCTLGYPVNLEDYLMYRHCLLYNDIAKDTALINTDSSIRFYFRDDQKEAEKLKKLRQEVNRAKTNYVNALADDNLFNAIFIQYCVINNLPVVSSLYEERIDKEIKLDKFSQDEPVKFNKLFNNSDIKLMSDIEHLIARGELMRSSYNQNISDTEGKFIGANMAEAIAWFKSPENTSVVEAYKNKLRNI